MIRIFVLVLLAANLLYFGWSSWLRDEKPRLVAPEAGPRRERAPAPAAAVTAPPACTTLGPISDDTLALEIEELLRDMQLLPARRNVTTDVREGWWVFVSNSSAAAQARTLRAIQGAGIRDAFAMADDPEFRVSVGLFTEEERASSRAEAVRRLRLEAVVSERVQEQVSVWFDLPGTAREAVRLDRLTAEGVEIQDLRLEECPAAAQPGEAAPPEAGPVTPDPAAPPV
jgi:hypothetical protein